MEALCLTWCITWSNQMHKIRPRHKKWQRNPDVHSGHVGAHPPYPNVLKYECGWENVHSCTLPGPKIGGDCDDDDQKAVFKKGASLTILGIAKHCWCPSGHGTSWTLALIRCAPGSHICGWRIFAPCVGSAPKRENYPIMIR